MRTIYIIAIIVVLCCALTFVKSSSGIGFCEKKCEEILKWEDAMTSAGNCFWVKDGETSTCVDDELRTDSGMDKACMNLPMNPTTTIQVGTVCDNCCATTAVPRKCLSIFGTGDAEVSKFIKHCVAR
jgi:hypothetical protein